jgi:DNA ligase-1
MTPIYTSSDVYHCISVVANEPSRNAKIYLLEDYLNFDIFRIIVELAYDPYKTYGVLKVNRPIETGDFDFDSITFELLDALAGRDLTGNIALEAIRAELERLNYESGGLFIDILNKDLRAGFNVKSINKAMPGLIPEIGYMRCSLLKDVNVNLEWDWSKGIYSQEKMDGMFVNINIFSDGVSLLTRKGHRFENDYFANITRYLSKTVPYNCQLHGELLIEENNEILDRKTSNGIFNHLLKGKGGLKITQAPVLYLWDIIPENVAKYLLEYNVPYEERFSIVQTLKSRDVRTVESKIVFNYDSALDHYFDIRDRGGEGTIIKHPALPWKNHTSKFQIKMKAEKECELEVVDFNSGKGKFKGTLGSLVCMSDCGCLVVNVSGFTDEIRDEIWSNRGNWMGAIVTIRFNEVIKGKNQFDKYSLFLPRFIERRLDKDVADELDYIARL